MELDADQLKCLDSAVAWYRKPAGTRKPFFRINGVAGSGKTTIIQRILAQIAEHCPEITGRTRYMAPTGKAALVMRRKGCHGATTIHKAIYRHKGSTGGDTEEYTRIETSLQQLEAGLLKQGASEEDLAGNKEVKRIRKLLEEQATLDQPLFKLNADSDIGQAKLIVISEASMIPEDMAKDLLSFKVPILMEGDSAQLPPVFGAAWFMKGRPDFQLSNVHRQAKGSPILELARKARMGTPLRPGDYGDGCQVIRGGKVPAELALSADQIIVGRNATRHDKNDKMRRQLGFVQAGNVTSEYHLPKQGEKLVCLRNDNDIGLLNGSLWKCQNAEQFSDTKLRIDITSDEDSMDSQSVITHSELFKGVQQKTLPTWSLRQKGIQQFDFGYALTCHKSQGSQWDFVIVYDESKGNSNWDSRAWLYTAVTRAAKRLVIVQA